MQTAKFDLTKILGCTVRDARVQQLMEFCEEAPELSERSALGYYNLLFRQTGFSLLIDASDVITTIHVRTRADAEYAAYPYELPLGVAAHMTQSEARALLCPPTKSGGPVQFPTWHSIRYWDLWEFGDHSVHFEYPEDRLSVSLVTLNILPCD